MNQWREVFLLPLILIILSSCQSFSLDSFEPSTYSTPTPSWGVQTINPEYIRPTLFSAEDLNWEVGTYREMTAGLINHWTFDEGVFIADDVMGALIEVSPGVWRAKGGYISGGEKNASQDVMLYADESTALLVGELGRERSESFGLTGYENADPRLNIVVERCWRASGTDGEYQNCTFWGQHGRYVLSARMTVDGEIITMNDWVVFLNVIQDRLIAQVERENAERDEQE